MKFGEVACINALALAVVLVLGVGATQSAHGQTSKETVLYSFTGGADGGSPFAGLIRDAKGNFYGTTSGGGASGYGTVFRIDPTGKENVLYSFTGTGGDGAVPYAGLVRDAKGNLYGTTSGGGEYGQGTVFQLDATGKETVLHSFYQLIHYGPLVFAGLVRDAKGNLYGTMRGCGLDYGCSGEVFKVSKTGKETVLYGFGVDGDVPEGGLLRDDKGNFYGTANIGGTGGCKGGRIHQLIGCGTVFKLDSTGKDTVLYSFAVTGGDGVDPHAGLIRDATGNLYGTTLDGGAGGCNDGFFVGCGTVFQLDATGKETVLYSFTGTGGDGAHPHAGLIRDGKGNLYGTTTHGGSSGAGIVFKLDTSNVETVLHSFTSGGDGVYPYAGLIRDAKGNLYGTTTAGGTHGYGTVFKLTP